MFGRTCALRTVASSGTTPLLRRIQQTRGPILNCPGVPAGTPEQLKVQTRSVSFSVEVVPPLNRQSGDDFDASIAALRSNPRIAFVSIGSREPLLHSAHVKRALATHRQGKAGKNLAPLVINVCCRGLGDQKAVLDTKELLLDSGVEAVCVLGGVGPSAAEDAFTRPTELLRFWRDNNNCNSPFADIVVGANCGPYATAEAEAKEWALVEEKISLGATVVLSRPTFQGELLQSWASQNIARNNKENGGVCLSTSYLTVARPKLFSKLAARPQSGAVHPMLQKRLAAALLPQHPASPLSEDEWEDNLARIFERDGNQVLTFLASEDVLHVDSERQHLHLISYGGNAAKYASLFIDGIEKMLQLERTAPQ